MNRKQEVHSQEYQDILDSIPGGVIQCLNDKDYTILKVNQSFLDMFGFTAEEILTQFHNHYIEMIHPSDRSAVLEEKNQQTNKERLMLTYRVHCKNGSCKWIMENSQLIVHKYEKQWISRVMIDITDLKNAADELNLSLERHQIIMDQTEDVLFEWNLTDNTIKYSSNCSKKFGYEPTHDGIGENILNKSYVHPDDISTFMSFMETVRSGNLYSISEFRISDAKGQYIWCRIRATVQDNITTGKPRKVVGIITDINKEKQILDDLRRRAERDALTGLYNRAETERQIQQYLESRPKEICALFMIDTDNFKQVNDNQGHLFGDAVLSELAAGMKKLTRQTDVVGRIGGDEFTIFLKNISSKEIAVKKAGKLLDLFQHLFEGQKQNFQVTCSAGVAIYPDDGEDFHSLYRNADMALYQAKSHGKNQYALFEQRTSLFTNQTGGSTVGTAIDSDFHASGVPENLASYVFEILYNTTDIGVAVQLILEIVGKRFDVSRAYVFENSEDGKFCTNTYEWCNEETAPQKEFLQKYPYENLDGYEDLFQENSIFYCSDIRSLKPSQTALFKNQGVCSTLQCAVRDESRFWGFVGFDECTGTRMWTKEETGMLSLISQLITTFLLKKRTTERDKRVTQQLNTILDMQNAYVYAIDQETYELLYLNRKTIELDPEVELGMTCYKAFFDRNSPCEHCTLTGHKGEFYNPRYKVWTKVQVAPMRWANKDAYLLSCFDVTEYRCLQELET